MGTRSIYYPGAAFNGNKLMATRPLSSIPGTTRTNYVTLTEWCKKNQISKSRGRYLIKKKMLIAQRIKHQWFVCVNPQYIDKLLNYLGKNQLLFDANN